MSSDGEDADQIERQIEEFKKKIEEDNKRLKEDNKRLKEDNKRLKEDKEILKENKEILKEDKEILKELCKRLNRVRKQKTGDVVQNTAANWETIAFGSCADMETQLRHLNDSTKLEFKSPPITGEKDWLQSTNEGEKVSLKGKLQLNRTNRKSSIKIEIAHLSETVRTESSISVIIVEKGVGKDNFRKIVDALDKDRLVAVTGVVQKGVSKKLVCVNDKCHVALVEVKDPVVHYMDGTPVTFPVSSNDGNIHRLLGSFTNAWFCPGLNYKGFEKELHHHMSAYCSSDGGVIYLGLDYKCNEIKPGESKVENVSIKLSGKQLEDLKKQIEQRCLALCPPCEAKELQNDSRVPQDNIKGSCFNSYFLTSCSISFTYRCVVRMIIYPSEYCCLHLCSKGDINLGIRHGTSSSPYPISRFISKMSSAEVEQILVKFSKITSSSSAPTIMNSNDKVTYTLGQLLPSPEDGKLDYKECSRTDPVKYVTKALEHYGPMWLNDTVNTEGTLRIGVSDKPHLVTGVWLDNNAMKALTASLSNRFKASLDQNNFCFPASAAHHFALERHQIIASSDAVLSKSSEILVLWLKMPLNDGDNVRRDFYCSWAPADKNHADKTRPILKSLLHAKQLVLPLNVDLKGLRRRDDSFPVAISKTHMQSFNDKKLHTLIAELEKTDKIAGHQFIDVSDTKNILDNNFCVLDVTVTSPRQNVLYLCKVPKFWKLDSDLPSDDRHIGGTPTLMDFQEIVKRCKKTADKEISLFFKVNRTVILHKLFLNLASIITVCSLFVVPLLFVLLASALT